MDEKLLQQFVELISKKTGLCIRPEDIEKLKRHIFSRLRFLKLVDKEDYYNLLKTDAIESRKEWKKLMILIATGESYFFRDKGQFALLKEMILPDLIEKRKKERSVRIWSAGCSTGEEPYSVAILLDVLLPDMNDWNILILGTDINEEALEKAKKGIYTQWSFRMNEPDFQRQYFKKQNDNLRLNERIKNMVRFSYGNLMEDAFPDTASDICNMDLILCRNVLIYFKNEAISFVVKKFTDTLNRGGYLMTGHGELHLHDYKPLQARVFSESVVYQKIAETPAISTPPLLERVVKPEIKARPVTAGQPLIIPYAETKRDDFETLYREALSYADAGDYRKALESCRRAIEIEPYSAKCHFLLSQIAEAQGNMNEAEGLLKKAIYLNPEFIAAYLELAFYHDREGDLARGKKMRETALELLGKMPEDAEVEPYKDITAMELLKYVRKMMK